MTDTGSPWLFALIQLKFDVDVQDDYVIFAL